MKKRRSKNYTLYWMAGISAVLTIPVAAIIINRVQADNMVKSIMIMAVFLILLIAIMILYKNIFGVTVQEIAQEDKVTELDRQHFALNEYRKKYMNVQIRRCIEVADEQLQRFKRRKNVMLQISGADDSDSSSLAELVQTVEAAIVISIDKIINRIEIFDDQGIPEVIRQHIAFIDEQLQRNNKILIEFETLITETSRMGEVKEEKDVSKLRDVVNAMQSLRNDQEEIDELAKKYDKESN